MKLSDIINSPERWTKNTCTRNANGDRDTLDTAEPEAGNSFCLLGACYVYARKKTGLQKFSAIWASRECVAATEAVQQCINDRAGGNIGISSYNDRDATTFEDIKAVLACADAKLEQKG